jgi:hypothetical protein
VLSVAQKNDEVLEVFLAKNPELENPSSPPFRYAAVVNSNRWALWNMLKEFGLPISGSGGEEEGGG